MKLNPTLSPTVSPILTDSFAQKIVSFNLSYDQWDLLNNAGFTPINFLPSEITNQMINMSGSSNDIMVYDKNNEGGISLTGFNGKISLKSNVAILGLLSVTTNDHYAYLVQVLYEYGKDKEYLIEFYEAAVISLLNKLKNHHIIQLTSSLT
ncbi:hypothetical protein A2960_01605 [Candidatus Gottesmanbacteria bacterium RIFCSPLOWO2_01_FULL_39_12b]|uniref:Uncharacterized protein n=1 Tax=Candidatus Gottesmanbacteria bacterium RIFCSPLOWO2_01_FULL_39_12b TaxID=1798388 RepID=A0A1F6AQT0_9BACT|nr:MAG: hypothetical protein A2960_01605 [Candidatus Gottesmanbacteria bacterium RIFCSPLOWO2_01_FULL_39_12b]